MRMQSRSSSVAKWATPDFVLWVIAPPSSSKRDLLVRHRLDHVGAGDEHVARPLDHDREVGDGRGVDRAAGAGPEDRGDLRDDAGGEGVAQEDVGVAAEATATPSWIRAPPESFRPTTGAPFCIARSMMSQIFRAFDSDRVPPKTVKSWAKT